jgi:hypothetical protein
MDKILGQRPEQAQPSHSLLGANVREPVGPVSCIQGPRNNGRALFTLQDQYEYKGTAYHHHDFLLLYDVDSFQDSTSRKQATYVWNAQSVHV